MVGPETLDVTDSIVDVEATLIRASLRSLDEDRGEVDSGHLGALRRGALRNSTGATTEIEPFAAGTRLQTVGDRLVEIGNRCRDLLERPASPHHALSRLQLFERHLFALLGRFAEQHTSMAVSDLFSHAPNERPPETAPP